MSKFGLMFLLVFLGGIFGALFFSGYIAFVVYELVYFLNPPHRWWGKGLPALPYSFIIVASMMFVYFMRFKYYNQLSPWREQPCFKWMVLLLVIYYALQMVAIDQEQHSLFKTELAKLVIIMLLAYKLVDTRKAFDAVIWAYLAGAFYIGYLATVTGRNSGDRVEGIGMIDAPDANGTAAALVPSAVLLMYLFWQGGKYSRLFAMIMGAIIANGIVLINSRGSFLGVVASLGIFLMFMIFSRYQKEGQKVVAIFSIVLGLAGALLITDAAFWERMSTLQQTDNPEVASGASRMVFWWRTFDMLEDHPLGLGGYGYNRLAPVYLSDEERAGVLYRTVHSIWFQCLGEVGYQGFVVFMLIFWSLFRLSHKAKKFVIARREYESYFKILALECALVGYLVAATFINMFRAQILYWMILFLALAIKIYYLQPRAQSEDSALKGVKSEGSVLG